MPLCLSQCWITRRCAWAGSMHSQPLQWEGAVSSHSQPLIASSAAAPSTGSVTFPRAELSIASRSRLLLKRVLILAFMVHKHQAAKQLQSDWYMQISFEKATSVRSMWKR